MQRYLIAAATSIFLLHGCASSPPDDADRPEALNCKIDGLLFQDLARLRDAGQPTRVAVNRVYTQYQGLVATLDERSAVDFALSHRNDSAKFVYAHKNLQPATLRYLGSSACLISAPGTHDPGRSVALAGYAEECQRQYPPDSAEAQLRTCIVNQSAQLIAH
ncbi:MAG: hypothetical protein JWR16_1086 [Nevskia sp.]|nr:hypothetical protein [Nevskia sp.]